MTPRRGAILLETLIALALFLAASGFALGAMRTALARLERSVLEGIAIDLAQSKLAELEAGISDLADLRDGGGALDRVGSIDVEDLAPNAVPYGERWELEVDSEPSEYDGLSLVTITIREVPDDTEQLDLFEVSVSQLIPLRDDGGAAYDEDELLDGLPAGGGA